MSEKEAVVKEATKKKTTYSKEQLLMSRKYSGRKDILNVLLEDGRYYDTDTVEKMINEFMKRKVD